MTEHSSNPGPYPFPAPIPPEFEPPQSPLPSKERDLFGKEPPGDMIDWSHRKGEPRVFALLWMIFLLTTTALMFARLATGVTISPTVSRPASREMLLIVAIGMSILWPMTRLCQQIPRPSIVMSSVRDLVVVIVPMQAVIWPQRLIVLGGWSSEVVLALSLHMLAWGLVIAGSISLASLFIAGATHKTQRRTRALSMLGIMLIVFAFPILELLTQTGVSVGPANANLGWMLSPITGVMELTTDRSVLGKAAFAYNAHFRMIAAVACVGFAFLVFGKALENARWVARRRIDP
ncbi:MAG: hypothetical protein JJ974_02080 [Phycisphaerales bacterium]|nr:hypothetical protein [Phycisphaerales bacterium]